MIIWLLGISGAGKTTLGRKLYNQFLEDKKKVYLIDGDEVRSFFDNDLGYSIEDRKSNIKRIIYAAHVLSLNEVNVIVCNISPFEELREFSRNKLTNYIQIYLHKSIDKSRNNDIKSIYKNNIGKTDLIGIDIQFDEPLNNDLVLNTDLETVEESLQKILTLINVESND